MTQSRTSRAMPRRNEFLEGERRALVSFVRGSRGLAVALAVAVALEIGIGHWILVGGWDACTRVPGLPRAVARALAAALVVFSPLFLLQAFCARSLLRRRCLRWVTEPGRTELRLSRLAPGEVWPAALFAPVVVFLAFELLGIPFRAFNMMRWLNLIPSRETLPFFGLEFCMWELSRVPLRLFAFEIVAAKYLATRSRDSALGTPSWLLLLGTVFLLHLLEIEFTIERLETLSLISGPWTGHDDMWTDLHSMASWHLFFVVLSAGLLAPLARSELRGLKVEPDPRTS